MACLFDDLCSRGGKTLELYKTYKICGTMKLMEHYGPIFKTSGTIFKPVEHEELYMNPEELCTFFFWKQSVPYLTK